MHPILLNLGFLKIYTYGFCIAIGFIIAVNIFIKKAKSYGYDEKFLENLIFSIFFAGLLGARGLYIIINFKFFYQNPIEIFKIWNGGLVFFGGFIVGFIFLIFYLKKYKIPLFNITDLLTINIPLAHAFGRIGCFMAGCCYGKETNSILGVVYKNQNCLAPINIKLLPVQLFEAIFNFSLFFFLYKYSKNKNLDGKITSLYLIYYSMFRFFIEFFRGDDRGNILFLSVGQFISCFIFLFGIYLWIYLKKKISQ